MNSVFFTTIEGIVIASIVRDPNGTVCWQVMVDLFNHHVSSRIGNDRDMKSGLRITMPTQSGAGELPKQADSTQLVAGDQSVVDLLEVGILKQFDELRILLFINQIITLDRKSVV